MTAPSTTPVLDALNDAGVPNTDDDGPIGPALRIAVLACERDDARAEVERLRGECCVCEKCGHVQAEPNWCHKCGHRTSMPEWAKPLVEAFHEAKLLRDIGERMCEALRHEANALCDEWDNEVAARDRILADAAKEHG